MQVSINEVSWNWLTSCGADDLCCSSSSPRRRQQGVHVSFGLGRTAGQQELESSYIIMFGSELNVYGTTVQVFRTTDCPSFYNYI
jgi:hypothetical protein